jgi:hypothetical protein
MPSPITSTQPIEQHVEKAFARGFLYELKLAFFTSCFAIFCILAIIGAWDVSQLFQNESYKAVVFFLDFITISNITGKYTVWIMKS